MPVHAIEPVRKVQAQENVIRMQFEERLNPMNNGLSSPKWPKAQLNRGQDTRKSARRKEMEGQSRGSPRKTSETAMGRTPPSFLRAGMSRHERRRVRKAESMRPLAMSSR